jgi:TANFOR domain-containing protein
MLTLSERTCASHWIQWLLSILLMIAGVVPSAGQAPATQANVVTTFSPPYTVALSEIYASQQLNVIVTAVNGPLPSAKLSVVIQGNNGIRIENDVASSPFSLDIEQGVPYQLTGGDLDEIFQPTNFRASGITVAQAFNDGLPSGNYEICFRVYVSSRTGWTPISQASPIGCASFVITESATAVMITSFVQPPPFTPDLETYLYKLNATLTSATSRRVRLFLTISGDNGVAIRSRQGTITPDFISLQAALPYTLSSIDLEPYFQLSNLEFTGISAQAIQASGLPEGNYRFCLRALDAAGNFISGDDPMGCSNLVTIRLMEPPQLITPKCGDTVKAGQGQMPIFSWTPPPGAAPGLIYTLRIVEMVDPNKNPNDAMLSATTPAFFEETIMGATTFLYGPGQPVLEPGRKYAWQVIAGLGTGPDLGDRSKDFRNMGRSEVCWFTVEEQVTGLVLLNLTPKPSQPKAEVFNNSDPLPMAGVTGKLLYKFKEEQKKSFSTGGSAKGGNMVLSTKQATPYNQPPNVDASDAQPLGNVKISVVRVYLLEGKGSTTSCIT